MKSKDALSLVVALLLSASVAGCGIDISPLISPTSAATATVEAVALPSPTTKPTPPPVETPTPVPVPPHPDSFEQYPDTIVQYLNDSRGDEDGLRAMLNDWDALRQVTDLLRVDVDDDGVGEILMVVVEQSPDYGINLRGDVLVVDWEGHDYRLAYSGAGDSIMLDPSLLEVDDLNGDGLTEMAFSSTECGAHTCFTTVHIVTSGTGAYQGLTGEGIDLPYVDPYFSDWDNDGVPELIMHGGMIGSVGAGPQRERTEVYRWDGAAYVLAETVYHYSNYLFFKVLDANQALMNGDYETAAMLYREAVDNPGLDVWMEESEREELVAFSRYRLALTHLMGGEVGLAEDARDELLTAQPDSVYVQVVTVLWDAYQTEQDLRAACEEVGRFAASHPETADVLADYGYGNPAFTTDEVCPIQLFD